MPKAIRKPAKKECECGSGMPARECCEAD